MAVTLVENASPTCPQPSAWVNTMFSTTFAPMAMKETVIGVVRASSA